MLKKVYYTAILPLIVIFNYQPGNSQTNIWGVKNSYAKVTGILSKDTLTISPSDTNNFKPNDTVMIVQMKGADFDISDNLLGKEGMNSTGQYEFVGIESKNKDTITLRSYLIHKYDVSQYVQLVRVPAYGSAIVTGKLSCTPWDSIKGYGGILALIVNDSLTLQSSMDVSGTGFQGGDTTVYMGGCLDSLDAKSNYYFTTDSAGLKGEGFNWSNFAFKRGYGGIANGGGGGDGLYSGGGGGAGIGIGGYGSNEFDTCNNGNYGGAGGAAIPSPYAGSEKKDTMTRDRIFMGGGGGAGSGPLNSAGTRGGNGGGIIFIITHILNTNNNFINSNGDSVSVMAKNSAGAGGGGGGGYVIIAADTVFNNLNVKVQGGLGGNSAICSGKGGGGGGGFVWTSFAKPDKYNFNLSGGLGGDQGDSKCNISSYPGGIGGDSLGNLIPVLNGFLFNIINGNSTICWGTVPGIIGGTVPKGGNGSYTYQWQILDSLNYPVWHNIKLGANSKTYQSGPLNVTTYFRRIVTSLRFYGDTVITDLVTDTSKYIKVSVNPEIFNSITTSDTSICYGISSEIKALSPTGGGQGTWDISWSYSQNNTNNWMPVTNADTDYAFTIQNASPDNFYYYKRMAKRNGCPVYDSIKIKVYPAITKDSISASQTICSGVLPGIIQGSNPSGGVEGVYQYKWILNHDSIKWADTSIISDSLILGVQTNSDSVPIKTFYRRIVNSGLNNINICTDTTNTVVIEVVPKITNNIIQNQKTIICEAGVPGMFSGLQPKRGDGHYIYQWFQRQIDSSSWKLIQGSGSDSVNFISGALYDTTLFRRVVFSGSGNCCSSTSDSIEIVVQPSIKNNIIIGDTTICQDQEQKHMVQLDTVIGGDGMPYHYQWQSTINVKDTFSNISGANLPDYQSGILFDTTYFRRMVSSGACNQPSDTITVSVLDSIKNNNLSGSPYICEDSIPRTISGGPLAGGNGSYKFFWQERSSLSGPWQMTTDTDLVYKSDASINNTMYYRRIVFSGLNYCCKDTSKPYAINLVYKPVNNGGGPDITDTFGFTVTLNPLPPNADTFYWASPDKGIRFIDSTNANTRVSNLKLGNNLLWWIEISRRVCKPDTATVTVTVKDICRYDGFSPNGDGLNDYFVLDGLQNVDTGVICEIKIFNRSGIPEYSNDHYEWGYTKEHEDINTWNGTRSDGEPLPDDTYYYILRVNFLNGESRVYKGFVVLKR